ncbi:hypothetical protein L2725_11970 [Shewanella corallii]|uniref:Uncharacterized protein n=1 Tax=Shewanella corallii TaxID=560080 RepID=A0ABT0N9H4_9GAMM|nr:hypothetical protein [Shewanella corallii]MCL2914482.1 hypothetical protein [Shewanella corallii]
MKSDVAIVPLLAVLAAPASAQAMSPAQEFGACMTDSLSGKERKELAKWIYFGMSHHSTIKQYSNATAKDTDNSDRYVGQLITRLLTKDCPETAKLAFETGGVQAFEMAFGFVGEVAMQELMTEASVSEALGAFEKYLDQAEFDRVFN